MARTTSTNFTGANSFPKASADSDAFDAFDVQQLAAAVDAHDHTTGKGVVISTSGGGGVTILLDFKLTTDVNVSISSGAWTDAYTFPTFTPTSATRPVLVSIGGNCFINLGAATGAATRVMLDPTGAATTTILGGMQGSTSGWSNGLAGAPIVNLGALSTSAHTLKLQAYISASSGSVLMRASSNPNTEFLRCVVWQ